MIEAGAEKEQSQRVFLDTLVKAGHLIPSSVKGVYGYRGVFESVVERVDAYVTKVGADQNAEVMRFPPVLSREAYERTDHLETMPQLLGSIHSFAGEEREYLEMVRMREARGDWSRSLTRTDVVLPPAACYPLYPTASGILPPGGRVVDLLAFAFRHEPSDDPARMQMFRQREYVRLGTPEQALAHRDEWLRRGEKLLASVGLDVACVTANDPFFGRGGRVMKATQREQGLKFELVVPITSRERPTAVASSNYHLDHFGLAFDIRTADGAVAHSACIGFGLERIALALFSTHGMDPDLWPHDVRSVLELS
jgi:seryl-tRNA synthetase